MKGNNPNLDLASINAFIKFGEILSICSHYIEGKRNTDIKGHNSVTNLRNMTSNNPNQDLVHIKAITQSFVRI